MTTHHRTIREQSEIMLHSTPGCLDILTFVDTLAICFTGITSSDGFVWQKEYTVYKGSRPRVFAIGVFAAKRLRWCFWSRFNIDKSLAFKNDIEFPSIIHRHTSNDLLTLLLFVLIQSIYVFLILFIIIKGK